jgi:hypothetical protein
MIRRIRALASLSRPERWTLLRAACWLLLVDLGLRVVGFARLQTWLFPQGGTANRRQREWGSESTPMSVERTCRLVAIMARHHLYPMRCLTRALASQRMLAAKGIRLDLRIGVRREHNQLRAHAWLEYHGQPVGESAEGGMAFRPLWSPKKFGRHFNDPVRCL